MLSSARAGATGAAEEAAHFERTGDIDRRDDTGDAEGSTSALARALDSIGDLREDLGEWLQRIQPPWRRHLDGDTVIEGKRLLHVRQTVPLPVSGAVPVH